MAAVGMTNLQRYFENVVNVPHTVLGTRLKPLGLLHMLWLQQIGSPLVNTEKTATVEDLEVAVLVCSSTSSGEILSKLDIPAKWSIAGIKRTMWHAKNRTLNLEAEYKRFLAYQDDYCCLPTFMPKDGQGTDEKLPYLLLYAAALIKATGWSEEKVMGMPLGQVVWLNTAFGFLNSGETNVVSDKESLAMELLKQLSK